MPRLVENALVIYTDGSLYPKGRKGGYALVFVEIDEIGNEFLVHEECPPGRTGTTNNRMELQACIEAIQMAPEQECFSRRSQIVVRTDSRYVVNNYPNAMLNWRTNGWKTIRGRPVENERLWKDLIRACLKVPKKVTIEWVKGHGKGANKDPYNDRADKLAKQSANNPMRLREYRSSVRRKKGTSKTTVGSILVEGQIAIVYIVEVALLKRNLWKYRYQIAPDYENTDWIYSEILLRDGHHYEVELNSNMDYPQILKVIREDVQTVS